MFSQGCVAPTALPRRARGGAALRPAPTFPDWTFAQDEPTRRLRTGTRRGATRIERSHPMERERFLVFVFTICHLTFAPAGTSSAKVQRTGLPSGPTEAASNMPLDSRPRIFLGARLVTITTLRPTRSSGA